MWLALIPPILWGSSYAAIGLYLNDLTPIWLAVWRALGAGLLLMFWVRGFPALSFKRLMMLSLLNVTLFFPLLMVSAFLLPGAVAGTLGSTFVIQVLLFRWLLDGVKPRLASMIAAVAGIAGVALLLNPGTDFSVLGAVSALTGTACIAVATVLLGRWSPSGALGLTAWQLVIGGTLLAPLAFCVAGLPQLPTGNQWLGLFWLVVLNSALGYWLWMTAIGKLGADRVAPAALLNPVTAVILGTVILNEQLDLVQWLGIFVILAALIMNGIKPRACSH